MAEVKVSKVTGSTFKYRKIVDETIRAIELGALRGKLASVREYAKSKGVGVSTVTQAYYELARQGWIVAEPKRGYFVCPKEVNRQPDYGCHYHRGYANQDLVRAVQYSFNDPDILPLSCTAPSSVIDIEPVLNRLHKQALKQRPYKLQMQDPIEGIAELRQEICRHFFRSGQVFSPQQLLITNGRKESLLVALAAAGCMGKTLALESPVSFYFQAILSQLNADVIEVPIQANYDDELALLTQAHRAQPFSAYLVNPSFSDPTGRVLSRDNKLALIYWAQRHGVTLIEYDRSELYFGAERPVTLASLIAGECVEASSAGDSWATAKCKLISIGGFYDTLSPSISLGYLICINTLEECQYAKQTLAEEPGILLQHMVSSLMASGEYPKILARLRRQLRLNCLSCIGLLQTGLPNGVYMSQPAGGPCLWLQLPEGYSSELLWSHVIASKLSIAPGTQFSFDRRYDKCFRITYGLPWNEAMVAGYRRLADIIAAFLVA
ncbi:PLP-dependent aminotransferase family protein [Shewanella sp. AS16]|uniref:aminotransferase-like domain-containing protein n=1 Tax=Shewanella sp. AS16 TaxID=2907625 RepID=UPI001F32A97E|nr:PLP-dependent aminotransferase family protein [Shewanella sp. AS16]MCE9686918.1 PLP-dependent aminotransferase family protein [Shewanella sp. AS16]